MEIVKSPMHSAVAKAVKSLAVAGDGENPAHPFAVAAAENPGSWVQGESLAGPETAENPVPWDPGESLARPAHPASAGSPGHRESQVRKGRKAPPAPWGQRENRVREAPQVRPAIRKTAYLPRFQAGIWSCRNMQDSLWKLTSRTIPAASLSAATPPSPWLPVITLPIAMYPQR